MARQTSKPFRLGIITSRKTRRGWRARTTSIASSPSDAVTISTPSSVEVLERLLDERADVRFVVDDQDGGHRRTMAETAPRCNRIVRGRATWTDAIGQRCRTIRGCTTSAEIRPMRSLGLLSVAHAVNHAQAVVLPLIYLKLIEEFGVSVESIAFLAAIGACRRGSCS